jgi:Pvc16 N-terminal domain
VSNSLAVATVTATLYDLLSAGATSAIGSSAKIRTGWPDQSIWSTESGINIFLYEVTPNAAWRNEDLPSRRETGEVIRKPQAALNLKYLFSFYGNDAQLEQQRLLGATVSLLHSRPLLDREAIRQAVNGVSPRTYLQGSDLDQQVDLVRFTPLHLNMEELSRLWTTFPQSAYALSVVYEASVVLIEADETVAPVRTVQSLPGIGSAPFRQPTIDSVTAAAEPHELIVWNSTLVLTGSQLTGAETRIRIGELEVEPASERDDQLTVPVPAALRAGVLGLQVVQRIAVGGGGPLRPGPESNVAAFVLRPTVELVSTVGSDVTVSFRPPVAAGQRAALLLNEEPGGAGRAYRFERPPETTESDRLKFSTVGAGQGTYVFRCQVDGAQSTIRESGGVFEPQVTIW